jgi:hypothetical protein
MINAAYIAIIRLIYFKKSGVATLSTCSQGVKGLLEILTSARDFGAMPGNIFRNGKATKQEVAEWTEYSR